MDTQEPTTIVAPVWGRIYSASPRVLQIAFECKFPRTLHAPMAGTASVVNAEEGNLGGMRERPWGPTIKKALVRLQHGDISLALYIEVATHNRNAAAVRLDIKTGDAVEAGQEIGEICVDSLVLVYLPAHCVLDDLWTRIGAHLVGGVTEVAHTG